MISSSPSRAHAFVEALLVHQGVDTAHFQRRSLVIAHQLVVERLDLGLIRVQPPDLDPIAYNNFL